MRLPITLNRRRLLQTAASCIAAPWMVARAQPQSIAIADMHSHWGMLRRRIGDADPAFADELRAQRVALVAWKMVADARWIRSNAYGIEQVSEPAPGELAAFFDRNFARMRAYVETHKLKMVLAGRRRCVPRGRGRRRARVRGRRLPRKTRTAT